MREGVAQVAGQPADERGLARGRCGLAGVLGDDALPGTERGVVGVDRAVKGHGARSALSRGDAVDRHIARKALAGTLPVGIDAAVGEDEEVLRQVAEVDATIDDTVLVVVDCADGAGGAVGDDRHGLGQIDTGGAGIDHACIQCRVVLARRQRDDLRLASGRNGVAVAGIVADIGLREAAARGRTELHLVLHARHQTVEGVDAVGASERRCQRIAAAIDQAIGAAANQGHGLTGDADLARVLLAVAIAVDEKTVAQAGREEAVVVADVGAGEGCAAARRHGRDHRLVRVIGLERRPVQVEVRMDGDVLGDDGAGEGRGVVVLDGKAVEVRREDGAVEDRACLVDQHIAGLRAGRREVEDHMIGRQSACQPHFTLREVEVAQHVDDHVIRGIALELEHVGVHVQRVDLNHRQIRRAIDGTDAGAGVVDRPQVDRRRQRGELVRSRQGLGIGSVQACVLGRVGDDAARGDVVLGAVLEVADHAVHVGGAIPLAKKSLANLLVGRADHAPAVADIPDHGRRRIDRNAAVVQAQQRVGVGLREVERQRRCNLREAGLRRVGGAGHTCRGVEPDFTRLDQVVAVYVADVETRRQHRHRAEVVTATLRRAVVVDQRGDLQRRGAVVEDLVGPDHRGAHRKAQAGRGIRVLRNGRVQRIDGIG